ncbi:MAG: M48 family metalloprotease [Mariprofundus sp.]|nr:M48 family metalloprotease [Mariprofundus sp.]
MKLQHRAMITVLLSVFFLLGLSACATNPATKSSDFVMMSEEQELVLGQKAAAEANKSLTLLDSKDPLVRYVNTVGQKMAAISDRPNLYYRFHVVDDSTINAFALPGGYIYIHRGLLIHLNSEAELAAVLGHEIGHVTARHSVKQYSKAQAYQLGAMITSIFLPVPQGASMLSDLMATAVIKGYGRDAELQADELSIRYLPRAGYDPNATIGILKTLKRLEDIDAREKKDAGDKVDKYHGAFSTHPETEKRIREAVSRASASKAERGMIRHQAILTAVDGYPYGDSGKQGAVVGRRFLHPDLGIQLLFPEEWIITNTPSTLQARLRQKNAYFQLQLKELVKRQTATEVLQGIFPKRHLKLLAAGTQAGMTFAHAQVQMSAPHVSQATIDAYVFLKDSQAFVMAMWSNRDDFSLHLNDFSSIAHSFRKYNIKRDGDIPRITLYHWKMNDSWKRLATKSKYILGRFTPEKFAALNGMDVSEHPRTGALVKTVR